MDLHFFWFYLFYVLHGGVLIREHKNLSVPHINKISDKMDKQFFLTQDVVNPCFQWNKIIVIVIIQLIIAFIIIKQYWKSTPT